MCFKYFIFLTELIYVVIDAVLKVYYSKEQICNLQSAFAINFKMTVYPALQNQMTGAS